MFPNFINNRTSRSLQLYHAKDIQMKLMIGLSILLLTLAMKPARKNRIVFFGDSITQMGIEKGGYIDRIQTIINDKGLQKKYELIGAGIGGNKVYDLYLRLEEDVLAKKPGVVVIWVGVNDVWHKASGTGTDLDKYEKFYVALIKKMQAKKIKVILVTPAAIGERNDGTNPQDRDLDLYSDVIRKLAQQHSCELVDLRTIFMQYEKKYNASNKESGMLTTDKVHLNDKGNQLVADEMWKLLMK